MKTPEARANWLRAVSSGPGPILYSLIWLSVGVLSLAAMAGGSRHASIIRVAVSLRRQAACWLNRWRLDEKYCPAMMDWCLTLALMHFWIDMLPPDIWSSIGEPDEIQKPIKFFAKKIFMNCVSLGRWMLRAAREGQFGPVAAEAGNLDIEMLYQCFQHIG